MVSVSFAAKECANYELPPEGRTTNIEFWDGFTDPSPAPEYWHHNRVLI